ncbi:MAG: class I SAM-dependent RNA methyltransferase [Elusimicrobia bacterium]|nr:class I SAM-dependent RNA methyltransferase [Elusimicrobiota bacterium]
MILLITAPTDPASVETLKPHLAQLPHAALIWAVSGKISDVATSERMQILSGRGSIEERLKINGGNSERTLTFQISPHSFFQTNTSGAEFLYSKIREWLIPYAGSDLYDLYCGAGGISLAVCELFRRILAVEANPAALSDAQENARGNHISNVSFFCGRVEEFLRNPRGEHSRSLAVLDPPRAGLHPKALKELLETPFSQLFYISCNPQSLVRDLKELRKCYKMLKIESVDLFPHTEHIEVLVHLCPK